MDDHNIRICTRKGFFSNYYRTFRRDRVTIRPITEYSDVTTSTCCPPPNVEVELETGELVRGWEDNRNTLNYNKGSMI